jgi:hypothetical protein
MTFNSGVADGFQDAQLGGLGLRFIPAVFS